ncbi:hypothetical protein NDR87_12865 [Nocardia sp. CDC159]|uniref:DUF8176 domain-containing protein n=1 Tax=Nocardia pulmonis TaxID=2951408 RepID=A0A9X2IZ85_9NOCA|nr:MULTISPECIES: hypothetical protein [Nocardia]MCM6774686.1 hypothetical protein [Nocardia pulmonis]MCM6787249.1 hypothetical protein [Nocardia sp. CDC159]
MPPAPPIESSFDEDGAARYPHYIRQTEPEPFDIAFVDQPPTRRAEFTGGWTDWVGNHAPGPDDDYPVGDGEVVHFPWDDEDEPAPAERPRPRRRPRVGRDGPGAAASPDSPRARPSRLRIVLVLAVAVLLLTAAAAFALYLLRDGGTARKGSGPPAVTMQLSAVTTDAAAGDCPTEQGNGVLRSAEPGGTESGPAAILWFQHSYYVQRSGERAWEVVAPGAAVPPPAVIQRGIDSVPVGTTHCVRVATQTGNRFTVEVTERRPGDIPKTYDRQTVTTAVVDGRTLITSITAG